MMSEAVFSSADELAEAFRPGARFANDKSLTVRFFVKPVRNEQASLEAGRPIFKDTEYIEIYVPGDKDNSICRPVRTNPIPDAARFPEQYRRFKDGLAQIEEGTPLASWPAITRAQVEELRFFRVNTVEQLAEMPDTAAQNFAGLSGLRAQARDFLERAKGVAVDAKLRDAVSKKDEQIAALSTQLAQMQEAIRALQERDEEGKKARK